jgi:hypothetical protein
MCDKWGEGNDEQFPRNRKEQKEITASNLFIPGNQAIKQSTIQPYFQLCQ